MMVIAPGSVTAAAMAAKHEALAGSDRGGHAGPGDGAQPDQLCEAFKTALEVPLGAGVRQSSMSQQEHPVAGHHHPDVWPALLIVSVGGNA